jgi:hypothetical protein
MSPGSGCAGSMKNIIRGGETYQPEHEILCTTEVTEDTEEI